MTPMMGSNNTNAASPACGSNSVRTCSGPYAVDEIASGESAPSATGFESLSEDNSSVINGFPRKMRLHKSEKDSGTDSASSDGVTTTFPNRSAASREV